MREQVRLLNVFQDNVLIHDILLKRFLRSSGKASGGGSLAENKFLVTMPLNTEKRSIRNRKLNGFVTEIFKQRPKKLVGDITQRVKMLSVKFLQQ